MAYSLRRDSAPLKSRQRWPREKMRTSCRARPPCGYAAQSPAGDRVAMGEPSPLALSASQLRSCNGPKIGAEKLRRQNVAFIWPMERGGLRLRSIPESQPATQNSIQTSTLTELLPYYAVRFAANLLRSSQVPGCMARGLPGRWARWGNAAATARLATEKCSVLLAFREDLMCFAGGCSS